MTLAGLERSSPQTAAETLAYLAQRPYDNVYTYWLLDTQQFGRGRAELMLWRNRSGAIRGTCTYGAQIIAGGDEPEALEAFAQCARVHCAGVRMLAGRRCDVEAIWNRAGPYFPRPRAIRRSQPVYAIERGTLRYTRDDANVEPATLDELDELTVNSAAMIAGEMDGDAAYAGFDFRARTARIIRAHRWWRYRHEGRLAFMCNVGAIMPAVAQLHGVWSPPDMRGQGHATRALGAICDHLLERVPHVSLYVNAFNRPALALYERVGFERVGEFQTILLPG